MVLRAPSAAPVVQPKGRKRKFIKGGDVESSQRGGSNRGSAERFVPHLGFPFFFGLASFRISKCSLASQFVSLIDGIRSCGRGKWRRRGPELGRGDG